MRKVPTAKILGAPTLAERRRLYDRTRRGREAKDFYHGRPWLELRLLKLANDPYCQDCLARGVWVPATTVHHDIERTERPDLALDMDNLRSSCPSCHAREHARRRAGTDGGDGGSNAFSVAPGTVLANLHEISSKTRGEFPGRGRNGR